MQFKFGPSSQKNLDTAHPDLQRLARESLALGIMDFAITEGHRDKARQDRMYDLGKSKVRWPNGKHNKTPSDAIDAVPYINGEPSWNKLHCCVLAGIMLACAARLDVKIRWGGNWDRDGEPVTDQDFQDLVHFERV